MEDPAEVVTPPGVEVPADGVLPSILADVAVPTGGGTAARNGGAVGCCGAGAVTVVRAVTAVAVRAVTAARAVTAVRAVTAAVRGGAD